MVRRSRRGVSRRSERRAVHSRRLDERALPTAVPPGTGGLAFAGAELVGGNGSIAAFVAGLTLGNTIRAVCARVYEFGEAEGQLARPCGSVGSFAGAKLLRRRLLDRIDAGAHAEILPGAVESKRRKLRRA